MFLWLRGYAPLVLELLCGGAGPPDVVFLSEAALIAAIPPFHHFSGAGWLSVLGCPRYGALQTQRAQGCPCLAPRAWLGIGHSFGMGSVSAWEMGLLGFPPWHPRIPV